MKVVKEIRKCVQCGKSKWWYEYSIVFGKSDNDSYLRRLCKSCEVVTPGTNFKEVRKMEREVQRLLKKKLQLDGCMRDNEEHLKVALKCLKTAQNVPQKAECHQLETSSEGDAIELFDGIFGKVHMDDVGEEVQGEE